MGAGRIWPFAYLLFTDHLGSHPRIDDDAMALGGEAALFADAVSEVDQFREFDRGDLAGVDVDEKCRGALAIGELVVGGLGVEEDLLDDAGFGEQLDGAIDGGFADAKAGGTHGGEQLVGLKDTRSVAIAADDRVENLGSLRGVLEPDLLEFPAKHGAERLDDRELLEAVGGVHG